MVWSTSFFRGRNETLPDIDLRQHSPGELLRDLNVERAFIEALLVKGGSAERSTWNAAASELLIERGLNAIVETAPGGIVEVSISARARLRDLGMVEQVGPESWRALIESLGETKAPFKPSARSAPDLDSAGPSERLDQDSVPPPESVKSIQIEPESIDNLLSVTLQLLTPDAFERLCKNLLLACGFSKVEVTGRTGDGGIDGHGILQVSLINFYVLFQCKRYQGAVGSPAVRDFRGALQGRTDKGIIFTTSRFTQDAKDEATRQGALPIELVDGVEFRSLLVKHGVGVERRTKTIELHSIDRAYFKDLEESA